VGRDRLSIGKRGDSRSLVASGSESCRARDQRMSRSRVSAVGAPKLEERRRAGRANVCGFPSQIAGSQTSGSVGSRQNLFERGW